MEKVQKRLHSESNGRRARSAHSQRSVTTNFRTHHMLTAVNDRNFFLFSLQWLIQTRLEPHITLWPKVESQYSSTSPNIYIYIYCINIYEHALVVWGQHILGGHNVAALSCYLGLQEHCWNYRGRSTSVENKCPSLIFQQLNKGLANRRRAAERIQK